MTRLALAVVLLGASIGGAQAQYMSEIEILKQATAAFSNSHTRDDVNSTITWCKDAIHSLGYATETALLTNAIAIAESGNESLANGINATVGALSKLDEARAALLCDPKLRFD